MINQITSDMISKIMCYSNILEFLQLITGKVVIRSFFGDLADKRIFDKEIQIVITDLLNDMGEIRLKSKYVYVKRLFLGTKAWKFFPTESEKEI